MVPALALREHLLRELGPCEVVWAYPEGQLAERFLAGCPDRRVRLPRVSVPFGPSPDWSWVPFRLLALAHASRALLKEEQPDAVVGFGGSNTFFPVLMAARMGIPCVIHEQNARPGRANRLLARWADRVWVGFEEALSLFPPGRSVCTGNPTRLAEFAGDQREARMKLGLEPDSPTLLVLGGSQGAHALNELVRQMLAEGLGDSLQLIHVTGPRDFYQAQSSRICPSTRVLLFDFCDEMGLLYRASDLVLSRAGALTLAELALCGRGALVVPYPHAGSHQWENAVLFERAGAARLFKQKSLTPGLLRMEIEGLFKEPGRLRAMSEAARGLAKPDAGRLMCDELGMMLRGGRCKAVYT